MKRLKELEKENDRLRKAISDLTLEKLILKEAPLAPHPDRDAIDHAVYALAAAADRQCDGVAGPHERNGVDLVVFRRNPLSDHAGADERSAEADREYRPLAVLYFIYENRAQGRVRVHVADCGFCAVKEGFQQLDPSRNGQWHGPYEREAAFSKAAMLGWSDVGPCPTCRP